MSLYAIGITRLPRSLKIQCPNINQISLADDVVCAGKMKNLKIWLDRLVLQVQKNGYYVNGQKILGNRET